MRILLVNDHLQEIGGAERSTLLTSSLLREHNHQVEIFGSAAGETAASWLSRWFSLKYYLRMRKTIREFKPDVVHCASVSRVLSPSVLKAAVDLSVPVVITVRDAGLCCVKSWATSKDGRTCPEFGLACLWRCTGQYNGPLALPYYLLRWLKTSLHRILIRRYCGHFITPSAALHDLLSRSLNLPDSACSVIPNFIAAVDPPVPVSAESRRLLYVGRLSSEKGVEYILKAAVDLLSDPLYADVHFDIAGSGPDESKIKTMAVDLGLGSNVVFYGPQTREQLKELYAACIGVLVPSVWFENNPRVILEAMAAGRPVVATPRGGIPEMVDNNITGLLADPLSGSAFLLACKKLLSEPTWAASLGRAGWSKSQEIYGPQRHYEKLIKVYQNTAAKIAKRRRLVLLPLFLGLTVSAGAYILLSPPSPPVQSEEFSFYTDSSLAALRRQVGDNPRNVTALWRLVHLLDSTNQANENPSAKLFAEQMLLLSRIVELDPHSAAAYKMLADTAYKTKHYDKAVSYYQTVLSQDSSDFLARTRLGISLVLTGKLESGELELNRVLEVQPDSFEALAYIAVIHAFRGRRTAAIEQAEKAFAAAPSEAERDRLSRFITEILQYDEAAVP